MMSIAPPEHLHSSREPPNTSPMHFLMRSEYGFSTPPVKMSSIHQHDNLETAKRRLNFQAGSSTYFAVSPAVKPIILNDTCPPAWVADYYEKELFPLLAEFLIQRVSRFYFALHWSGDTVAISELESSAVWGVVVLVTETILQETRYHVERFLLEYEPRIPIRVREGTCEWLNSATLGGYVVGETSNQVFAMTVGHLCFEEPQPLNSPPPPIHLVNQFMQPSGQDANGQRRVEAAAEIKTKLDRWWYSKATNSFAMPVLATWTTTSTMMEGEIPEVQDLCLASVYESRVGNNATSPSVFRGFRTGICGVASITPDRVIYKVGRSTGYTEGRITSMKPSFFFDKRLGCRMTSYYFEPNRRGGYNTVCEMGDSGSWLIDVAGKVVGMLHAAVIEKIDPLESTKITLGNGCFIPIQKCLDLCEKYLGEKFHVMT